MYVNISAQIQQKAQVSPYQHIKSNYIYYLRGIKSSWDYKLMPHKQGTDRKKKKKSQVHIQDDSAI